MLADNDITKLKQMLNYPISEIYQMYQYLIYKSALETVKNAFKK